MCRKDFTDYCIPKQYYINLYAITQKNKYNLKLLVLYDLSCYNATKNNFSRTKFSFWQSLTCWVTCFSFKCVWYYNNNQWITKTINNLSDNARALALSVTVESNAWMVRRRVLQPFFVSAFPPVTRRKKMKTVVAVVFQCVRTDNKL